jgi:hypothetical protein
MTPDELVGVACVWTTSANLAFGHSKVTLSAHFQVTHWAELFQTCLASAPVYPQLTLRFVSELAVHSFCREPKMYC